MGRSRHRPASCRQCGRSAAVAGTISRGGLCLACGHGRQVQNTRDLQAREGVGYERWLAGQRAWLEREQVG